MPEILYNLAVKHTEQRPVFILGHSRSGTSILIKMIRKYLKINFGTESQFIVRFYKKIDKYLPLNEPENLFRLINDLHGERWFKRIKQRFGFELDKAKLLDAITDFSYAGVLRAIFEQFAEYHDMVRWGDKTPEYIFDLPVLNELFPDARYIHIVRDGRDVALSEFKTQFGAKNIYKAAEEWSKKVKLIRKFAAGLPSVSFYEIRYEDFLAWPEHTFSGLIDFLKIDDDDNWLSAFIFKHLRFDLRTSNYDKWKLELNPKQIRLFEKVAGDLLSVYGYERSFPEPGKIHLFKKMFWSLHNFILRKFRPGFVEDNIYRLSLRFKDGLVPFNKPSHYFESGQLERNAELPGCMKGKNNLGYSGFGS